MSDEENIASSSMTKQNTVTNKSKKNDNTNETPITIRRTNGKSERYDIEKIALDVSRSGVPYLLAKEITKAIYDKIEKVSGEDNIIIEEEEIRKMIVEELKTPQPSRYCIYFQ